MVSALTNLGVSFLAGLAAPLVAVCVLPLYPAFLAYLGNQLDPEEPRKKIVFLSLIITLGILVSMFLVGLIFTKILEISLTSAISIISPIAFGILAIISVLLIFNVNFAKLIPKVKNPVTGNPYWASFLFGFFFGAVVLPCNPASLAVLFAVSTTLMSFVTNLLNFIVFGVGMSIPLWVLALISSEGSGKVIGFLTEHTRKINLIVGLFMLIVSLYYLIFVFRVFGG